MGARLIVVLLLVTAPTTLTPGEEIKSSHPDVVQGVRQVEEGDFETAIETLDAAVKKLAPDKTLSKDLARAYLYMAIAYLELSQEATARAKFAEALANDNELNLSTRDFPPKIIRAFEEARTGLAAKRPKTQATWAIPMLFDAVKTGDLARVQQALTEDPSLANEKDKEFGATPLHWAALRGHAAIVGFLLAKGADPSATNNAGETALRVAERAERADVVAVLQPAGGAAGDQAVIVAARAGNVASLQGLIRNDRSLLDARDSRFDATPLHWAALKGRVEAVEYLLSEGADPAAFNGARETPLQVAQRVKRSDVVRVLSSRGSGRGGGPSTASGSFHDVVKLGDFGRIREMLDRNPSLLNARDAQFGATPLHWAALKGRREVVEFLLARGADPTLTNNSGETPAVVARRANHPDIAALLE